MPTMTLGMPLGSYNTSLLYDFVANKYLHLIFPDSSSLLDHRARRKVAYSGTSRVVLLSSRSFCVEFIRQACELST